MKIVFIEFVGKGGMIHYAFQLCRAMAAEGADVTLITDKSYELRDLPHNFAVDLFIETWDPRPKGRVSTSPLAVAARKVRRVGRAVRYYTQWLRVVRRVASLKPDVVLLGDIRFPGDLLPLMLLRRKSPLFADICHNIHPFASGGGKWGGLFKRSAFQEFFYRRIYRLFDAVFVHYERNREEFVRSFGIPERKVGVIVHGNEEIFRDLRSPAVDAAALRARHGLGSAPVVLFFGTLSRYKGTDVLVEAFPRIHRETGAKLVLAGFPSPEFDVAAHQKLGRDHGVADHIVWIPEYVPSDALAVWMELASAVVFPYRDIYQSGALHVPQTFGAPIVATAIGAMRDVIEDRVSGLLVPPGDAEGLGNAIIELLQNRELAQRLGAQAAADAQGRFSWRSIARTIVGKLQR